MPREIELKLPLTSAQARRLVSHQALAGIKPQKFGLFNTYYDAPELDLCRRGVALRLRRKGWTVWLMTVKGGDPAAGALAQRREWEVPTQPGVFDFDVVTDTGLRGFLKMHQPAQRLQKKTCGGDQEDCPKVRLLERRATSSSAHSVQEAALCARIFCSGLAAQTPEAIPGRSGCDPGSAGKTQRPGRRRMSAQGIASGGRTGPANQRLDCRKKTLADRGTEHGAGKFPFPA